MYNVGDYNIKPVFKVAINTESDIIVKMAMYTCHDRTVQLMNIYIVRCDSIRIHCLLKLSSCVESLVLC